MDPGAFALIGAASFFGGVSRLTMSLTVIMVRIKNSGFNKPFSSSPSLPFKVSLRAVFVLNISSSVFIFELELITMTQFFYLASP